MPLSSVCATSATLAAELSGTPLKPSGKRKPLQAPGARWYETSSPSILQGEDGQACLNDIGFASAQLTYQDQEYLLRSRKRSKYLSSCLKIGIGCEYLQIAKKKK